MRRNFLSKLVDVVYTVVCAMKKQLIIHPSSSESQKQRIYVRIDDSFAVNCCVDQSTFVFTIEDYCSVRQSTWEDDYLRFGNLYKSRIKLNNYFFKWIVFLD